MKQRQLRQPRVHLTRPMKRPCLAGYQVLIYLSQCWHEKSINDLGALRSGTSRMFWLKFGRSVGQSQAIGLDVRFNSCHSLSPPAPPLSFSSKLLLCLSVRPSVRPSVCLCLSLFYTHTHTHTHTHTRTHARTRARARYTHTRYTQT